MIARIILAVAVCVVVALVCIFLAGPIIVTLGAGIPPLVIVGDFLIKFGWVLGLIAGIWYYFAGTGWTWPKRGV